jgi:hypothetical protein
MIFVFGSNLAGMHMAGAAAFAVERHGAIFGKKDGRQGNSYAIPTCDSFIAPLTLTEIQMYVDAFINYTVQIPDEEFQITRIGCGIAGFTDAQIAPLFKDAPVLNCLMPPEWASYYPNHRTWKF